MKFDGTEYAFLSNFYPSKLELTHLYLDKVSTEPLLYSTVEHAYQASKTFNLEERESIRMASNPGASKRLGRHCALREDWEDIKYDVMLDLLRKKFSNDNPELMKKLINTGDSHLVEGNTWHDNNFGVCVCIECGSVGKNMLGKLLMKVRDEIKNQ